MLVITLDDNKVKVIREFNKPSDLKKFLARRKLFIRPKGVQIYKGVYYRAFRVGSYSKDVTPRFHTLLTL